jgi:hypothetical protein
MLDRDCFLKKNKETTYVAITKEKIPTIAAATTTMGQKSKKQIAKIRNTNYLKNPFTYIKILNK